MTTGLSVTVVIVTYQSAKTISQCLRKVRRAALDFGIQCVIVDNGSNDGTIELIQGESSWATILLQSENLGFGKGCNVGFLESKTDYVLFLNPDAEIDGDSINQLVSQIEKNEKIGIIGPSIIENTGFSDAVYQVAGDRVTPWHILKKTLRISREPITRVKSIYPGEAPWRAEWVCGAVMLVRTPMMHALNGFDPRFFLYWEEVDLCARAEKLGFETWTYGGASAVHIGGASSAQGNLKVQGCIASHYYQSRFYYFRKHHGLLLACVAELLELIEIVVLAPLGVFYNKYFYRLRARLEAVPFSSPNIT